MTRPLRLAHVVPYFAPAFAYGGTVRAVYDLVMGLAQRGHQQIVLTTDAHDATSRLPKGRHTVDGIEVIRLPNLSNRLAWQRLFIPVGFGQAVKGVLSRVDVVHLHEARSLLNTAALRHLLREGRPYVLSPHGGLPAELNRQHIKTIYDRLFGERLLRHAATLHALNAMEKAHIIAGGYDDGERIIECPNGIDIHAFDRPADPAAFRVKYAIPAHAPLIGFLGRLNPIKGVDFLVDAFAAVRQHTPDAVLALVGPDDGAQASLETQVQALGLSDSVRFVGYISELSEKAAAYRAFDVYVLPSRADMQPNTPLEALLNHTPAVVTERCGLADYFTQSRTADVIPFGDVPSLAEAIGRILQQPPPVDADRIRADFNWHDIILRWEAAYTRLSKEH